jgi:maleate isomerase
MTIAARPAAPADLISNIEHIAFDTDAGVGTLANIGLLVLQTDQTIEDEFRLALPDGVALYGARLPSPVEITPDNLRRMEADIPGAVRLLPDVAFGAIGFGCTSGALVIGEAAVAERVREVMPGVKVTDPVTAAVALYRHHQPFVARRLHRARAGDPGDGLVQRGRRQPRRPHHP